MSPQEYASEPVYMEDADGVTRLAAAPGDPIPTSLPVTGIVTPEDPPVFAEPFDGYNDLTEVEVIAKLEGLSDEELDAVRAYERAHRARGAIYLHGVTETGVAVTRSTGSVDRPDTGRRRRTPQPADDSGDTSSSGSASS